MRKWQNNILDNTRSRQKNIKEGTPAGNESNNFDSTEGETLTEDGSSHNAEEDVAAAVGISFHARSITSMNTKNIGDTDMKYGNTLQINMKKKNSVIKAAIILL